MSISMSTSVSVSRSVIHTYIYICIYILFILLVPPDGELIRQVENISRKLFCNGYTYRRSISKRCKISLLNDSLKGFLTWRSFAFTNWIGDCIIYNR